MNSDRNPARKSILIAGTILLLVLAGFFQRELNSQRRDPELGLNRYTRLQTQEAPPMLAFVTVALGSFRGLIANALWIRATDLQDEGKYFEMVQLADWITKLEPTFVQVWLVQAWNMAYNISVKFTDQADRWRWVQRGIELLRDDALKYNPRKAMVYRELAWFFQHKIGQDLDDAHKYYKTQWALEMTQLFGGPSPNYAELLNPETDAARQRVQLLRSKYKMDPQTMKAVDEKYGPLEWRLPEAHAIYWASVGLENSTQTNLVFLRRAIYQSAQISVFRGRIIRLPQEGYLVTGPDLDKIKSVSDDFEQLIVDEQDNKFPIERAHYNFLKAVIYLLYTHNRISEAQFWFDHMREKYPDSLPKPQSLREYIVEKHLKDVGTLSYDKTLAVIEGFITDSYMSLSIDDDDRATGLMAMALQLWDFANMRKGRQEQRLGLPPFEDMKKSVLDRLLSPDSRLRSELKARLRTKLQLPEAAPSPPPP